mgnify:CR=1 FL=1
MLEILSHDFMVNALIGSIVLSITAPILGMFVVSRRISLVGDTLSHLAFAGIANKKDRGDLLAYLKSI